LPCEHGAQQLCCCHTTCGCTLRTALRFMTAWCWQARCSFLVHSPSAIRAEKNRCLRGSAPTCSAMHQAAILTRFTPHFRASTRTCIRGFPPRSICSAGCCATHGCPVQTRPGTGRLHATRASRRPSRALPQRPALRRRRPCVDVGGCTQGGRLYSSCNQLQ
jgi:hypothetical protein